jgi:hypothetical protein
MDIWAHAFNIDSKGVIPLPAPNKAILLAADSNTKEPLGCETIISSPEDRELFRKDETFPPFKALTPIDNGSLIPLQIE